MAKTKTPAAAYGTELSSVRIRSNHPIRSRYMAAVLAIILGIFGVNHFYLRNILRGFLMLFLTIVCIVAQSFLGMAFILLPVCLSVIQGLIYLMQSNEAFMKRNHVRTL